MKQSELAAEIEALIDESIAENGCAPAAWLVHTIIARHSQIEGDDLGFYRLTAFEHCRDTVRQVLRAYRPDAEDEAENRQLVMPGYNRIRTRYLVERNGDDVVLPTNSLTPLEIRTKAAEYRRMGAGCVEHAEELDRLASDREHEAEP